MVGKIVPRTEVMPCGGIRRIERRPDIKMTFEEIDHTNSPLHRWLKSWGDILRHDPADVVAVVGDLKSPLDETYTINFGNLPKCLSAPMGSLGPQDIAFTFDPTPELEEHIKNSFIPLRTKPC